MDKEPSEGTGKGSVSKGWQTASFACAEGEEKVNSSWDTHSHLFPA